MTKIILLATVLLSGCVTPVTVYHANKTAADFNADLYQCKTDGEQYAANLTFHGNPLIIVDRRNECLIAKGYSADAAAGEPVGWL